MSGGENPGLCFYLSDVEDRIVHAPRPCVKPLTPDDWPVTVFGSRTLKEWLSWDSAETPSVGSSPAPHVDGVLEEEM